MAKIALVTGAGSGIGKACAAGAGREGYSWRFAAAAGALEGAREAEAGARALRGADGRRRSRLGRGPVREDGADSAGSTCCSTTPGPGAPPVPLEELTLEQWNAGGRHQSHRRLPLHPGGVPADEEPGARGAGGSSTTARSRPMRRGRTRRPTPRPSTPSPASPSRPRSTGAQYDIACGQIDIGNAATADHRRDGEGRAAGQRRGRGRAADGRRARRRAVVYMAGLPLDANVQFMTVMATKMPFIGRG